MMFFIDNFGPDFNGNFNAFGNAFERPNGGGSGQLGSGGFGGSGQPGRPQGPGEVGGDGDFNDFNNNNNFEAGPNNNNFNNNFGGPNSNVGLVRGPLVRDLVKQRPGAINQVRTGSFKWLHFLSEVMDVSAPKSDRRSAETDKVIS